jgi:hypothetical protein
LQDTLCKAQDYPCTGINSRHNHYLVDTARLHCGGFRYELAAKRPNQRPVERQGSR